MALVLVDLPEIGASRVTGIAVAKPITGVWRRPFRSPRRKVASRASAPCTESPQPLAAARARHGRPALDFGSRLCRGRRLSPLRPEFFLLQRMDCASLVSWASPLRPLLLQQREYGVCALAQTRHSFGEIAARVTRIMMDPEIWTRKRGILKHNENRSQTLPGFKSKVVFELLREGKTLSRLASGHGNHHSLLVRWRSQS